ncbi:MAG: sulfurtransferase-like selenium metabolism protein YedF [Clostridiaceae bacterium]
MIKKVDARGELCPIPIIKAKNALKEIENDGTVSVLVDNETAKENLEKMAGEMGFKHSSESIGEEIYEVQIIKGEGSAEEIEAEETCQPIRSGNTIAVISSEKMGEGNDELGTVLMKSFIYTLTESEKVPSAILFYNGGAKLTVKGSPVLEDLKILADAGIEILTCGTCLNYFNITHDLAVGGVTNMYVILEKMTAADKIIKP